MASRFHRIHSTVCLLFPWRDLGEESTDEVLSEQFPRADIARPRPERFGILEVLYHSSSGPYLLKCQLGWLRRAVRMNGVNEVVHPLPILIFVHQLGDEIPCFVAAKVGHHLL